tara:strand:+ start:223 stop:1071 length:849 start_codon:yes stop_codon:yes gene_type:complete
MAKSTLLIHGGLGNQLFQFFFALNKLNGNTKLLRIIIAKKKSLHQLDIFDVLKKKEIENITIIRINSFFYKLISKINFIPQLIIKKLNILTDNNSFSQLKSKKNPFIIYGYFQDLRLLNTEIISDFIIEDLLAKKYLNSKERTLGIHIRRGDYLKKDHISTHGLISIKYIFERFTKIFHEFKIVKIYSDSDIKDEFLKYSKKYLGEDYLKKTSLTFSFDNKMADKDVFLDIGKNEVLICTNSTFSYWAGFISLSVKKIYLPNQWYSSESINKGLINSKVTLY